MTSIEEVLTEAVTTDNPQVLLSVGGFPDAYDACLERILQWQMQLDAQKVVRSWLRTQFTVVIRTPKSRNPIETFYQLVMRKAGPETFAAFYPDQLPKQRHRDDTDPVVQALLRLSEAGIKHDSKLQTLFFTYLLGESSEEALAELGCSESLINLDDKLFVLTLALRCLIGVKAKIGTGGKVGLACRVYLVLDEVENLLALPEDMAWAFTHWLEHLTHEVGDGLTFWLHIKTAGPTTMKDLQKRLGHRQLQEWVTDLVT